MSNDGLVFYKFCHAQREADIAHDADIEGPCVTFRESNSLVLLQSAHSCLLFIPTTHLACCATGPETCSKGT